MINTLSPKSYKRAGIDCFRCRDYFKALGYFFLASENSPDEIENIEWKMKCLYELKEEEICLKCLSKCEVLSPEMMMIESKIYLDRHDFARIDECTEKIKDMENDSKFKSFLEQLRSISNLYKRYTESRDKEEHEQATQHLGQLICKLPFNKNTNKLKVQQLQCLLKCGQLVRAKTIIESFSPQNMNAQIFCLRIQLFYYLRQQREYRELLICANELYPGYERLVKLESMIDETEFNLKQGRLLIEFKRYLEAIDVFGRGLLIDAWNKQTNALFQFNKAISYQKLKYLLEAKQCFNRAVSLNPNQVTIRKERALFNIQSKDYVAAILDYEKLMEIDPANREAYQKQIEALKKLDIANGKQDYYRLLNIEKHSSQEQIKRAYKILAMKYHPDRNRNKSPLEVAENSYKFMQATEAYKVLMDPQTRTNYDHSQSFNHQERPASQASQEQSPEKQQNEEQMESSSRSSSRQNRKYESDDDESSESRGSRQKRRYQKYSASRKYTSNQGKNTRFHYRTPDNEEYTGNRYSSYRRNQFTYKDPRDKRSSYNYRDRTC